MVSWCERSIYTVYRNIKTVLSLSNPCKIKTDINHFANQPFYILIIDGVQVVYTIYSAYCDFR